MPNMRVNLRRVFRSRCSLQMRGLCATFLNLRFLILHLESHPVLRTLEVKDPSASQKN